MNSTPITNSEIENDLRHLLKIDSEKIPKVVRPTNVRQQHSKDNSPDKTDKRYSRTKAWRNNNDDGSKQSNANKNNRQQKYNKKYKSDSYENQTYGSPNKNRNAANFYSPKKDVASNQSFEVNPKKHSSEPPQRNQFSEIETQQKISSLTIQNSRHFRPYPKHNTVTKSEIYQKEEKKISDNFNNAVEQQQSSFIKNKIRDNLDITVVQTQIKEDLVIKKKIGNPKRAKSASGDTSSERIVKIIPVSINETKDSRIESNTNTDKIIKNSESENKTVGSVSEKSDVNSEPRISEERQRSKSEGDKIKQIKTNKKQVEKAAYASEEERVKYLKLYATAISKLRLEFIFPLKRTKQKFPWAKFFCRLCDIHQSDVYDAEKHSQTKKHILNCTLKKEKKLVYLLKNPCKSHNDLLTKMIENVVLDYGLSDEDINSRQKLVDEFSTLFLKEVNENIKLHVVGSTATGAGLKTSDINIDLEFDNAEILLKVEQLFTKYEIYDDVKFDKHSRVAYVQATRNNLTLTVTVNQIATRNLTMLLKTFMTIDNRAKSLAILFRKWIDVINANSVENGLLPSYVYYIFVIFFLQQIPSPVLPIIHKFLKQSNDFVLVEDVAEAKRLLDDRMKNDLSLGELWFDMLIFYSIEFNPNRFAISITKRYKLRKVERRWFKRVYSMEDPMNITSNLIKRLSTTGFNYLQAAFFKAALYFGRPFKKFSGEEPLVRPWKTDRNSWENTDDELVEDDDDDKNDVNLVNDLKKVDVDKDNKDIPQSKCEEKCKSSVDVNDITLIENCSGLANEPNINTTVVSEVLMNDEDNFEFTIDNIVFTDMTPPISICIICEEEGHLKKNCPLDKLPELETLPEYTTEWDLIITNILKQIPPLCEPNAKDIQARESVLRLLCNIVSKSFKDVRLSLFGSSCNGFGFADSDVDVCMTLMRSKNIIPKNISPDFVLRLITRDIRNSREFKDVTEIPSAKVPIVKFTHKKTGFDGDISFYNILALRNTQLLKAYSIIDERCRILGYACKIFARKCDIGDASRGSLSSYAYILMVIYFLQHTNPPVLPVLQEIFDGPEPPKIMIDEYNTYFYENVFDVISGRVWPHEINRQTAGELWLEMLRFYTEKFQFDNVVICIRQFKELSTLKKLWTGCAISIEDPFYLNHNLGGALTGRMKNFILQAFHRCRKVFGTPLVSVPKKYENFQEYLFSKEALYPGKERPNERLCRKCGHIGHIAKDCKNKTNTSTQNNNDNKQFNNWWKRENYSGNNTVNNRTPKGKNNNNNNKVEIEP